MNNYEYCADFTRRNTPSGGRALDYGCGSGVTVKLARDHGVEAYGCDVFYDGGDLSRDVKDDLFGNQIFRMEGDRIPFPDDYFDVVTNNMVLEHVPDLGVALKEISRVLKPGGVVLSMFPDAGVWREGHCGVPFVHWFPKGSRLRNRCLYAARLAGFGHVKRGVAPRKWADDFGAWLDQWTYYRSRRMIHEVFRQHLSEPAHIEADWLVARAGTKARIVPAPVRRFIAQKLAHLALVAQKET